MELTCRDNTDEHRYEVLVDGEVAGVEVYHRGPGRISLLHTEIFPDFAGRGLAPRLVTHVLEEARADTLAVLPFCPYVAQFIVQHATEYLGLVPESRRGEFNL